MEEEYRPPHGSTPWHDPYVGSKRKTKKIYTVPDFGVDHDIIATHKHLRDTEKRLKHKWRPKKNEDGKYVVPTECNDVIKRCK